MLDPTTFEYLKPTDEQIRVMSAMWVNVSITRHADGSPRA